MSEPVSALNGASTSGIAQITELGPQGMITLRGDLADGTLQAAVRQAIGTSLPGPGEVRLNGTRGAMWMSPDELLLICAHAEAPDMAARLEVALAGAHSLVANVSDARAVLQVEGPAARDVLAKLAPVDLSPAAFTEGMFRRTRMAQIPAAFWMAGPQSFHIVTFRSVAQYAFDVLKTAAMPGSEVGAL